LFDEQKVKYRLLFYRHINSKIIFILSSFLIVQSVSCDNLFLSSIRLLYTDHLYFIGETVDVTGWLGGYNFQWAWSSGWAAGQVV